MGLDLIFSEITGRPKLYNSERVFLWFSFNMGFANGFPMVFPMGLLWFPLFDLFVRCTGLMYNYISSRTLEHSLHATWIFIGRFQPRIVGGPSIPCTVGHEANTSGVGAFLLITVGDGDVLMEPKGTQAKQHFFTSCPRVTPSSEQGEYQPPRAVFL